MISPHPFGYTVTSDDLFRLFSLHYHWEERYRQLITLAKQLPPLPEMLKQPILALSGCESRVWFGHQRLKYGRLHFYADSEGRIVRGLLAILLTAIEGKMPQQLLQENPLTLFTQLGLQQQLSTSRSNALQVIIKQVHAIAASYMTSLLVNPTTL